MCRWAGRKIKRLRKSSQLGDRRQQPGHKRKRGTDTNKPPAKTRSKANACSNRRPQVGWHGGASADSYDRQKTTVLEPSGEGTRKLCLSTERAGKRLVAGGLRHVAEWNKGYAGKKFGQTAPKKHTQREQRNKTVKRYNASTMQHSSRAKQLMKSARAGSSYYGPPPNRPDPDHPTRSFYGSWLKCYFGSFFWLKVVSTGLSPGY